MSMIADKIERFILRRLLEEESAITLRRNELATLLDCAPSQISYVLSTRFSNDRGFVVESRRGLGGSITISRIIDYNEKNSLENNLLNIAYIDEFLFQAIGKKLLTKREAAFLHDAFATILEEVPHPMKKTAVVRLYQAMVNTMKEG